jgi:DNA-binding CsgD family transcriptional regulator
MTVVRHSRQHWQPSVKFGSDDLRRMTRASEVLCAPLAYDQVHDWLRDAVPTIAAAVGADMYTAVMPTPQGEALLTDGVALDVVRTYFATYLPATERQWGTLASQLAAGAWSRSLVYGEHLQAMYRSAYWHDFIVPLRCFDTIGFTLAVGPEARIANIQFYHGSRYGRRFGEHGLAALRLLWPSFVVGARAVTAVPAMLRGLAGAVDDAGVGIVVADAQGRVVHRNATVVGLLDAESARARLWGAVQALLAECAAESRTASPLARRHAMVTMAGGRTYRLVATVLDALDGRYGLAYLVTVTRTHRAPADVAETLAAFGLTAREQEVAHLLMSGASNERIATGLGISAFTARHHTEHVLSKLGVRTRAEVLPRVQRRADDAIASSSAISSSPK